jgi:preprotein translocase subunit SecA
MRNDVVITLQRPEPPRKLPQRVRTNAEDIARASGQQSKGEEATRNELRTLKAGAKNSNRNGSSGQRGGSAQRSGNVSTVSQPSGPVKVGRNDLCPCGSGKKYKKCHGA